MMATATPSPPMPAPDDELAPASFDFNDNDLMNDDILNTQKQPQTQQHHHNTTMTNQQPYASAVSTADQLDDDDDDDEDPSPLPPTLNNFLSQQHQQAPMQVTQMSQQDGGYGGMYSNQLTSTVTAVTPAQPAVPSTAVAPQDKTTQIHGIGLWNSWTRNFGTPLLALWDLMDNAIDAACPKTGQVHIEPDWIQAGGEKELTGLRIQNTCLRPVAGLEHILKAYESAKTKQYKHEHTIEGESQSLIGENGVGVKQGCATLSDLSFVLTRNGNVCGLGILAKSLQKPTGIYLPSWTWKSKAFDDRMMSRMDVQKIFHDELYNVTGCRMDIHLQQVFATYGGWPNYTLQNSSTIRPPSDKLERGIERLAEHFERLSDPDAYGHWGQHNYVFCLVLHQLKHNSSKHRNTREEQLVANEQASMLTKTALITKRTLDFLDEIETQLPRMYLHISNTFDIQVNRKKVVFSYWQRRLVELTKFTVVIDTKYPTNEEQCSVNFDEAALQDEEYHLRIYLGFDPIRAADREQVSAASLIYYSRKAGRLIKSIEDGRADMGLTNGGTNFCQGLTVIVDDHEGRLPLNPTKQDFAFGEQATGDVHRNNLRLWIGAVVDAYWTYHFEDGSYKKKTILSERVTSQLEEARRLVESTNNGQPIRSIADCDLKHFSNLEWLYRSNYKSVRVRNRRHMDLVDGKDTVMKLPKADPPERSLLFQARPGPGRPPSVASAVLSQPTPDFSGSAPDGAVSSMNDDITSRKRRRGSTDTDPTPETPGSSRYPLRRNTRSSDAANSSSPVVDLTADSDESGGARGKDHTEISSTRVSQELQSIRSQKAELQAALKRLTEQNRLLEGRVRASETRASTSEDRVRASEERVKASELRVNHFQQLAQRYRDERTMYVEKHNTLVITARKIQDELRHAQRERDTYKEKCKHYEEENRALCRTNMALRQANFDREEDI